MTEPAKPTDQQVEFRSALNESMSNQRPLCITLRGGKKVISSILNSLPDGKWEVSLLNSGKKKMMINEKNIDDVEWA